MTILLAEIQNFKSTTVPCQYWYDNQWYDLTTFNEGYSFFKTNTTSVSDFAAFNFCTEIKQDSSAASDLGCTGSSESVSAAIDAYATLVNVNSPGDCIAASTSSYSSIEQKEYLLPDGSYTFGLYYSNPTDGCTLHVGLICNSDVTEYQTSEL